MRVAYQEMAGSTPGTVYENSPPVDNIMQAGKALKCLQGVAHVTGHFTDDRFEAAVLVGRDDDGTARAYAQIWA